ncbi:MAG: alpha/beta hydrolase [Ilumatobacteraceae bacterium]
MTLVFVHGVPVTEQVWEPVCRRLALADAVCLRLPGFGSDLPDSFTPTMQGYAEWLSKELAGFESVDLVGHDWGGLLVLLIASACPDNLRSWVVDNPNLDQDFAWHGAAVTFQTPERGEQVAEWIGGATLDARIDLLAGTGLSQEMAAAIAPAVDATMADAMLALYRSAVHIGTEWGPPIDEIRAPGLCVIADRDEYRQPGAMRRLAERTSAHVLDLPEAGHFWMVDEPDVVAAHLTAFWHSIER